MSDKIESVDGKCIACDRPLGLMPSEHWGPYKWLWTKTSGEPYTWTMRRHPGAFLTFLIPYLVMISMWSVRRWWTVLLGFITGFLTGHIWW